MSEWKDRLLPCPFCGSDDKEIEESDRADGALVVRCNDCGCANAYVWYNEECLDAVKAEAREKAIALWNRRATKNQITPNPRKEN